MKQQPTIQDVLDAMQVFSTQVDKQFQQVDKRFELVDQRFDQVDERFKKVDERFEQIDERFKGVDERFKQMDKQFLELRQAFKQDFLDVRTDFGAISRRGNTKMTVLIDTLVSKKVLDSKEADRILSLEPYAQS